MTEFKRGIHVEAVKKTSSTKAHLVGKAVIAIVVIVALLYGLLQLILVGSNIINHWQELKFAYDKPAVVKTVRVEYQKQQTKLDQSFANPQNNDKTQALLEQISNTLKSK